jgi:hypothetical protein
VPLVLCPELTETKKEDTRTRARAIVRWICIGCGHEWRGKTLPSRCRRCNVEGGYAPEEIRLIGSRSDDVEDLEYGKVLPEWSTVLPRGFPLGKVLLMRGRPGAGKSRIAFRLATQIGRAMIFGLEMGKILSLDTARSAGAEVGAVLWYEGLEGLDELDTVDPDVVAIDSIQKLGYDRRRVIDRLTDWAADRGRNVILISQLSSDGKSRYGEDADFYADMNCDVTAGRTDKGPRKCLHGLDSEPRKCLDGYAHVAVAKSRVCPLLAFDVPIIAGAVSELR